MKPGWRTTEFWMTAAANVVGLLMTSGAFVEGPIFRALGMAAMVLSTLGYTYSRGKAKSLDADG